jgi:hypothetical protein
VVKRDHSAIDIMSARLIGLELSCFKYLYVYVCIIMAKSAKNYVVDCMLGHGHID